MSFISLYIRVLHVCWTWYPCWCCSTCVCLLHWVSPVWDLHWLNVFIQVFTYIIHLNYLYSDGFGMFVKCKYMYDNTWVTCIYIYILHGWLVVLCEYVKGGWKIWILAAHMFLVVEQGCDPTRQRMWTTTIHNSRSCPGISQAWGFKSRFEIPDGCCKKDLCVCFTFVTWNAVKPCEDVTAMSLMSLSPWLFLAKCVLVWFVCV